MSYARVWGEDKYAVGRTYYQMHTDYFNEVGHKYGLERGDDISMLPEEEKRERIHKNKSVLEAERQAKDAIVRTKMENERLEGQKEKMASEVQSIKKEKDSLQELKDKIEVEIQSAEQHKDNLEGRISQMEKYAAALNIKEEEFIVPVLKSNPLVKKALDAIQSELEKPIPTFGQKEWREERRKAIKVILTDLQTELLNAKDAQKEDILKLGKSLYSKAMKEARAVIEQNKQLIKENGRLTEENEVLRKRIASMDENAINSLRDKKNAEIRDLQERICKAETKSVRSDNLAYSEHKRADEAENKVKEMMEVPEIRNMWDAIQRNKKVFGKQVDCWINEAKNAIYNFAKDYEHSVFTEEYMHTIGWGIIGEALKGKLDASDKEQRMRATYNLLGQISWTGTTDFMSDLTQTRTRQLCEEMTVTKDMMKNLLLAAGGRGDVSTGGGGSNNELTNWDGTKKRNGWGM